MKEEEIKESLSRLKKSADKANEEYKKHPYDAKDIAMDIIGFIGSVALGFGWMLLMLLIISFVGNGVLSMQFDRMVVISAVFAAIIAILSAIKKVKKYM